MFLGRIVMSILVTGGMGYIGSHTCVQLIQKGHEVVIFDNLCNSKADVADHIETITGTRPVFVFGDLLDRDALKSVFDTYDIDAVIHFAGLKAVGESVAKPMEYYHNNITGTLNLLFEMRDHGCKKLIFSSSATVYGIPKTVPISEDADLSTTNPYGTTKLFIEHILQDVAAADREMSVVLLRYFNPIGAHESGLIGDDPNGIPNNLMPFITRVAKGILPQLSIFGNDYDTRDGTGVRDYIHVCDLAKGHCCAMSRLSVPGVHIYNLGTGRGYSVLELIKAFEDSTGVTINYRIDARRPGDIAECYADPKKAEREIGFRAELGLEEMCRSAWNFEKNHQSEN